MSRAWETWALLGFATVAVAGVLLRPALPVDETRYLAVAWEMRTTGNWLVPTNNFEIYSHKPPALFWMINLVWLVTGVSETAARLVAPAFALLTLVLTGLLARKLWPEEPGIRLRAILALSGLIVFACYGSLTMFDAALAAATVAGVICIHRALVSGQRRHWVGLGVALAAGALIKGPVILFHLLPVVALAPIWGRDLTATSWKTAAAGGTIAIVVGLALVALWLLPAILAGGPEYRDAILWKQSAGRMASSFAHARPWWFFAAFLPLLLFPWILVPALWRAAIRKDWRDTGLRLCLTWALSAFVLFSLISGKQLHYLIPEMPAAALVVARLSTSRFTVWLPALICAALAFGAVAVVYGLFDAGNPGRLLDPPAAVLAVAVLALGICLLAIRVQGLAGSAILSLGGLLAFNLLVAVTALKPAFDTEPVAAELAGHAGDGIAVYAQTYQSEFNFAARLTAPVGTPGTPEELADWATAHPRGIVLARLDRAHPPWPEARAFSFRDSPYAIWRVADASQKEPMS